MNQVKIHLSGENKVIEAANLATFIDGQNLEGVRNIEQDSKPIEKGTLGVDWIAVVNLGITGLSFLVTVFEAYISWKEATDSNVTVEFEVDGKKITVEGKTVEEVKKMIEDLENKA